MNTATLKNPRTTPVRARPLMPLRGVMSALDRNKEQVTAQIEEGQILYGWNLVLQPERAHSTMLMVLPACIDSFLGGAPCPPTLDDVFDLLLPGRPETLPVTEIQRLLNVTETHVYALIRRKEIAVTGSWRKGPGGSGKVPTESFLAFLRRRRYPFTEPETEAPAWGRPLLNLADAMKALSADRSEVLGLIDEGKLKWIFDLNSGCELGKYHLLRFLPAEVEALASGAACPLDWQDVVSVILPSTGETSLRQSDICRALAIGEKQLSAFIERKELALVSAPQIGRPAKVSAEGLARFLQRRRYSAVPSQ